MTDFTVIEDNFVGVDLSDLTPEEQNDFCGECGEHYIDCFCYVEEVQR
jgi:hypothetical protein